MNHKHTVAVDLDGVLASYDGWKGVDHIGDPIPGAVEFTKALSQFARVLIFTTRTKLDVEDRGEQSIKTLTAKVKDWLDKHGFTYDEIYNGQGKPLYSALVDDRAVSCVPQAPGYESSAVYGGAMYLVKKLCGKEK